MAGNLNTLAKSLRQKADAVETAASRLAVIGTAAAVELLVYITPVDTSEHLSNWQVFIGKPAPDALPPYVPGRKGSTRAASAREAINQALAELRYKKAGQVLFISNLAPVIVKLDHGLSSQFPGGFVPRALVGFRVAIEQAIARGAIFNDRIKR